MIFFCFQEHLNLRYKWWNCCRVKGQWQGLRKRMSWMVLLGLYILCFPDLKRMRSDSVGSPSSRFKRHENHPSTQNRLYQSWRSGEYTCSIVFRFCLAHLVVVCLSESFWAVKEKKVFVMKLLMMNKLALERYQAFSHSSSEMLHAWLGFLCRHLRTHPMGRICWTNYPFSGNELTEASYFWHLVLPEESSVLSGTSSPNCSSFCFWADPKRRAPSGLEFMWCFWEVKSKRPVGPYHLAIIFS